jgi:predicted ester cyclase
MSLDQNRELIRRYSEQIWNEGRTELVEELFAPDFVEHNPDPIPGRPGGREGVRHDVERVRQGFPDFSMTFEIVCEDDRAGLYWSGRGTQSSTGKRITMSGIQLFRVRDGQITERWGVFDREGIMQQLAGE